MRIYSISDNNSSLHKIQISWRCIFSHCKTHCNNVGCSGWFLLCC